MLHQRRVPLDVVVHLLFGGRRLDQRGDFVLEGFRHRALDEDLLAREFVDDLETAPREGLAFVLALLRLGQVELHDDVVVRVVDHLHGDSPGGNVYLGPNMQLSSPLRQDGSAGRLRSSKVSPSGWFVMRARTGRWWNRGSSQTSTWVSLTLRGSRTSLMADTDAPPMGTFSTPTAWNVHTSASPRAPVTNIATFFPAVTRCGSAAAMAPICTIQVSRSWVPGTSANSLDGPE